MDKFANGFFFAFPGVFTDRHYSAIIVLVWIKYSSCRVRFMGQSLLVLCVTLGTLTYQSLTLYLQNGDCISA